MSKLNIKGGTPVGSASLCDTCGWALIVKGYSVSELLTFCTYVEPNMRLPFKVVECTRYHDRNRPNYDQMQKLAIEIAPRRFVKPTGFRISEVEGDEECEAARDLGQIIK